MTFSQFCRMLRLATIAVLLTSLPATAAPKKKPKPGEKTEATEPATRPAADATPVTAIKLPAPVEGVAIGGGGQYLVFHLKKLQQLAIYDASQQKVTKYLPIPSNDIALAAGAEKLFVGLKDLKQIQRYNLATLEREVTVPAPEGGIRLMAMGANATAPLLLVSEQGAKKYWQINPQTMQAEKIKDSRFGHDGGVWGPTSVHVSYDGSTAVACGGGWAGIELASIAGGRIVDIKGGSYVNGGTLISGNGQLVFPDGGGILRADLEGKVTGIDGQPFPAIDPAFSCALDKDRGKNNKGNLIIYSNADPRPLVTIRNVAELAQNSKMPLWQRAYLIPKFKSLVTVGEGGDQLMVRPFDLTDEMAKGGLDYLFVESSPPASVLRSAPMSYALKVQSKRGGVKYELQAGPPGMKLSPDGKIDWTVPQTFADPTASVIVQVSDSSGQTVFHTFVLKVAAAPVVVAAAPPPVVTPVAPPKVDPKPKAEAPKPAVKPETARPETPKPAKPPTVTPPPATTVKPATPTAPTVVVEQPKLAPTAPGIPDNPMIVPLAEPFGEYHAANGGATLVFYLPKAQELAVYDTATGKSLGSIKLGGSNARFACGADTVVVALPDQRILQTYSLKTMQRLKSGPIPGTKPLKDMRMGSASAGPLYVYAGGEIAAVDVQTLTPIKLRGALPSGDGDDRWFSFRPSADGSTLVAWNSHMSPSGFTINRLKNGVVTTTPSAEGFSMANRRFTPTADGSFVLYETKVYNAAGKAVDSTIKDWNNFIPTADPRFVIAVRNSKGKGAKHSDVAICTAADRRILATLPELHSLGDIGWGDQGKAGIIDDMPGAGEPRVVFRNETKVLALIPGTNDHFELIRLDLAGGNVASAGGTPAVGTSAAGTFAIVSLPPFEVAVGDTYTYQIQTLPEKVQVKYKVESGPQGLTVSPAGLVTWKVAERPIGGKANVILSVTNAAGQDVPHAFDITVVRGTPAVAAVGGAQAGTIVTADKTRLELPSKDFRYVQGMAGRGLILAGDQFAAVAPDGFTIQESRTLPRKYVAIAERKDYYVALCQEPKAIELLNKKTFDVIKSRPIAFAGFNELVLHPVLPISYVSYTQPTDKPQNHFLIFNETTAEARTDENWVGQWISISPDGGFLMSGLLTFYRDGDDIIDNPDRLLIVPRYSSVTAMMRYDLTAGGIPARMARREGVGGGAYGLRLSPDGSRAIFLSHTGFPMGSGNAGGWNPADLKQLPVSYLIKEIASTKDAAFHPLLPIVAFPGKGSVAFFNRDTGERQQNRVDDQQIAGEEVHHVLFSPDGKTILLHTSVGGVDYLVRVPLRLSPEEIKAVGALPKPDRAVGPAKPDPVAPPRGTLPQT